MNSDSDDDFLDELTNETGSQTPSTRRSKGEKEYKIRSALKPPRTTTYTAQSLYDQIHDGTIDLEPEYQRAVVWPEVKQVALLDSIFRNFYIPPVIFSVSVERDGSEKRTCIDGKQRLSSIQRFMDGLIFLRDEETKDRFWFKMRKPQLSEKYKKLFQNKQIVCIEYSDLSDEDEREIFRRVQLGVALTPAEVMRAESYSPRVQLVESIVDAYMPRLDGVFNQKRGAPFRWVAQSLFMLQNWPLPRHIATSKDGLQKWVKDAVPVDSDFVDKSKDAFQILTDLVIEDSTLLHVTKGPPKIAPIDLVAMITLIYVLKDRLSRKHLITAIKKMRQLVRDTFPDLMWNSKTLTVYFDFIVEVQKNGMEILNTSTPQPMQVDVEEAKYVPPQTPTPNSQHTTQFQTNPNNTLPSTFPSQSTMLPPSQPSQYPSQSQPHQNPSLSRIAAIKAAKGQSPRPHSPNPQQPFHPIRHTPTPPTPLSSGLPPRPNFPPDLPSQSQDPRVRRLSGQASNGGGRVPPGRDERDDHEHRFHPYASPRDDRDRRPPDYGGSGYRR
ncbi:hypothetical protein DENSPDRAFT_843331 [Dentipellis sp. KUC8613]|nr:hypothetical protein DENSPDRAFT_843331 [Dentipellis sp. KUC8613]